MSVDSGWDKTSGGSWKDSKPLGKSAQDFLMENPQWGVFVRIIDTIPCTTCYDPVSQAGGANRRTDCPDCFGTGFAVNLFIFPYRTRHVRGYVLEDDVEGGPGRIDTWRTFGFFPRALKPKMGDLLIEVEWSIPTQLVPKNPSRQIVNLVRLYRIEGAHAAYEREIGWYTCPIFSYDIDINIFRQRISRMQGLPILDVDSTWQSNQIW